LLIIEILQEVENINPTLFSLENNFAIIIKCMMNSLNILGVNRNCALYFMINSIKGGSKGAQS